MASAGTLLFFFHLISLLHTFINANSLQKSNALCPSFSCGNGFTISYPFWHQNQQSTSKEYCGYPGFNISCNDQNPVLFLSSNNSYPIRMINYSDKSIIVAHFQTKDVTCPSLHHDFTLSAFSLFNYSISNTKMLRFFYNCTLFPPSLPSISCLKQNAKRSYVFAEGSIPEFDWKTYCESTVSVPVIETAVKGDSSDGLAGALQGGFELTWRQPDGACQSCEATGGFCGYLSNDHQPHNNFFCHCPNGKHSINYCHDFNDGDLIKLGPNYAAIIGAVLLLGSLIMAATVFYFIRKKRVALYKPVSQ